MDTAVERAVAVEWVMKGKWVLKVEGMVEKETVEWVI